jgi:hypothetical protein
MYQKNLVDSMPRKLKDVTRREGNLIKYYQKKIYTK